MPLLTLYFHVIDHGQFNISCYSNMYLYGCVQQRELFIGNKLLSNILRETADITIIMLIFILHHVEKNFS